MVTSNYPTPKALAAINAGVTTVTRRVEIYEADGSTLWMPKNGDIRSRLISGSISMDASRAERRIIDLELDDSDGMLDSDNSEGFWYDNILKVYRGVRYPITPTAPHYETSEIWETQVGEFMIDRITSNSKEKKVKVTGRDYAKKCLTSKFEKSASFAPGTYLYAMLRALGSNAGIKKFKIPVSNETISTSIDVERNIPRWDIMKTAAESNEYDIYFDNEGYLTITKIVDPTTTPPIAIVKSGAEGNLVSYDKSRDDSRLYNHVIVSGDREAVEGGAILMPYFGEAKNEAPNSPTSIAKIGDRAYFYASSFFTSDQQCANMALRYLSITALESYDINFSSTVQSWIDVGNVIVIDRPENGTSERFLLDTLNIPLTLEPMSGTGKRLLISS